MTVVDCQPALHRQACRWWQLHLLLVLVGLLLPACSKEAVVMRESTLRLPHTANVNKFEFSSNGKWLLTAGADQRVIQWDARSGQLIRSFAARDFEIAAGGNTALIMARSGGRYLPTLVSLRSGAVQQQVDVPYPDAVHMNASLSRDGRYLLMVWGYAGWEYGPPRMAVWNMQTDSPLWDSSMPAPFPEDADEWESDFAGKHPGTMDRLKNDRKKVLFRRGVRPDGKVLSTMTPLADVSVAVDGKTMIVRHWDDTGSSTDNTTLWDIESALPLVQYNEPFDDLAPHLYGPDKKWFVRGKHSQTLELCDARTGKVLQSYSGHQAMITSVVLSPDGKTIVSGDDDGSMILWDRPSSRILGEIHELSKESITSLEFRADGKQFLVGTEEQKAMTVDYPAKTVRHSITIPGGSGQKPVVRYAPGEDRIITLAKGGAYQQVNTGLWDLQRKQRLAQFSLPIVRSPEVSPDGQWALVWSAGNRARFQHLALWHLPSQRAICSFHNQISNFRHQFWDERLYQLTTPGGATIHRWTTRHYNSEFRIALPLYSLDSLERLEGFSASTSNWLASYMLPVSESWPRETWSNIDRVISPDGRLGARWQRQREEDVQIQILEIASGEVIRQVSVPANLPSAVAFSPDAQRLIVAFQSRDRRATVTAWDTGNGKQLWSLENVIGKEHRRLEHLHFSPHGHSLAAATAFQRATVVLDAETGVKRFQSRGKVSFRSDGQRAIVRGDEDIFWNVTEGTRLRLFGTHEPSDAFAFSPNGRFLWHSMYVTYSLYSAETGELVSKTGVPIPAFGDQSSWHVGTRFGHDGTRFVTRRHDEGRGAVLKSALWDFDEGEKICDLLLPDGSSIQNATFTPDGHRLVTFFYDTLDEKTALGQAVVRTKMICWDATSGQQLVMGQAGTKSLQWQARDVLFTHAGTKCLSIHPDGVLLWNLETGEVEHQLSLPTLFRLKVLLAPNGRQVLAISPTASAVLWDLETGERIRQFGALHFQGPLSGSAWTENARFTENGKQVITISHNGRGIHLIDMESGKRLWSIFMDGDGVPLGLADEVVPSDAEDG